MSNKHNLDMDRTNRLGFPEVVYGAGKTVNILMSIIDEYKKRKKNVLITKLQAEKGKLLLKHFTKSFFDIESGVFILRPPSDKNKLTKVGIITAGTSDIPVANEAYYTLLFLGIKSQQIFDVGVAGIHRLLDRVDEIKRYDILIVVAGFEGALPSVVGGLFPQPIIAVPTSIGYGAAKNGETALMAMLSSCANGISVVNIDNGYGAAMSAYRILKNKKKRK
jgi:NCAIR mutase (PurE)-related protein